MPFFQNIFDQEFRGTWILGDRQYTVNFNIKGNPNSSTLMASWNHEPYNLTGNRNLTIYYAIDPTLRQFAVMTIDVGGSTVGATTATEVAAALNANANFAGYFVATAQYQHNKTTNDVPKIVVIKARKPNTAIRAYIAYTGAEKFLGFNLKAPVAELPNYFSRHTIANKDTFADGAAILIALDTGDSYQASIIDSQGFDHTTVKEDWELLGGRSGLFSFKKLTYDGSNRLTSIIEYPAGATVGDLATYSKYHYTGAATNPDIVTVEPLTLESGDLVTPPF